MLRKLKKSSQNIFKSIGYNLFSLKYGKIQKTLNPYLNKDIQIRNIIFDKRFKYKLFSIKKGRIYTDRIHNYAVIKNNCLVKGPSFQLRGIKNQKIEKNIVLKIGTPRKKKIIKGTVLSMITGGAGNTNFWHWMFDVLPRLAIAQKFFPLKKIDFFLVPEINYKFQLQSLQALGISKKKILSSKTFRHIEANTIISVDHPYVFKNNPTKEIQKMPKWISAWLKKSFKIKTYKANNKIYIDRKDAISNNSHLRKITNEKEVKLLLKKRGFKVVTLSKLSFTEQIKLFNSAKTIIGLHGAGFANVVFCKNKTKIIEIKTISAGNVIANLAKTNKLNYSSISLKSNRKKNDQHGHIKVPIFKLKNI